MLLCAFANASMDSKSSAERRPLVFFFGGGVLCDKEARVGGSGLKSQNRNRGDVKRALAHRAI